MSKYFRSKTDVESVLLLCPNLCKFLERTAKDHHTIINFLKLMTLLKQGSLCSHSPIVSARTFRLHLTVCSLFAIYRCVTRSCRKVVNKNCYHRKLSGMPRLSRYSCRDFSRSSSVEAVFDCVNNCRFAIRSTFSISPL